MSVDFGIDVERRRLVLHQGQDPLGVRRSPAGTAVAAAGAVIHQRSKRNITLGVRVGSSRWLRVQDLNLRAQGSRGSKQ